MTTQLKVGKQHGGFLPVPQTRGPWRIVNKEAHGEPCTILYRGKYDVWMDDSSISLLETEAFLSIAKGVVVTTGLGIGYVPQLLVRKGTCSRIIVVENDPDVIAMVWPHLTRLSPLIKLVKKDANLYLPDWADVYFYDHTFVPASESVRELETKRLAGRVGKLLFWDRVV